MVLKSGFRCRSSQITSMLRWVSASSRRLDLYCAPGNAGIAQIAQCVSIGPTDVSSLAQFAEAHAIDLAARYHAPAATGAATLQHFSSAQRAGLGGSDIGALWNVVFAMPAPESAEP